MPNKKKQALIFTTVFFKVEPSSFIQYVTSFVSNCIKLYKISALGFVFSDKTPIQNLQKFYPFFIEKNYTFKLHA